MRLDAFAGEWRVDRVIEDVRAGRGGRFEGRAWFTPDAEGLAYREEGVLTMEGSGGFAASRRYHWRDGGAGTIEVRFADGRLFHRFYADEPMPGAAHSARRRNERRCTFTSPRAPSAPDPACPARAAR